MASAAGMSADRMARMTADAAAAAAADYRRTGEDQYWLAGKGSSSCFHT